MKTKSNVKLSLTITDIDGCVDKAFFKRNLNEDGDYSTLSEDWSIAFAIRDAMLAVRPDSLARIMVMVLESCGCEERPCDGYDILKGDYFSQAVDKKMEEVREAERASEVARKERLKQKKTGG